MNTFIAKSDAEFAIQLNKTCEGLVTWGSVLGISSERTTVLNKCNTMVQFVVKVHPTVLNFGVGFTSYKDLLIHGRDNEVLGPIPLFPDFPTPLPEVTSGNVRAFYSDIIHDCKKSPKFTRDIGILLGFVKDEPEPKPNEAKPNLTVKLATGGHPLLHATKGIFQGYEVWCDKGDGKGYVKINISFFADYLDTSTLPEVNVGQLWKYKTIYIYKGEPTGLWSDEMSIRVFGTV